MQPMTTIQRTNITVRLRPKKRIIMTNFRTIFGTIFILTLLVSCRGGQTDNNNPTKQETPKALRDDKLYIESYSRSGDLTEELYQELVGKTPALKKLEDDLDAFRPKPNDLKDVFNHYDSKSNSYYNSANNKTTAMTDSLLRRKIISLLETSRKKYTSKTAELNSLLKQISYTGATLNDYHSVLKIVLTLPTIEKYQDDNKPSKKEFNVLINRQKKLISQTDSLTPRY
jgi:hypothetical protein